MESSLGMAALWMALALAASFLSIRFNVSIALVEIMVGIVAGNFVALLDHYQVFDLRWELKANEWIVFLAGFGSIMLTFMAGSEVEPSVLRRFFKESMAIGVASFAVPFVGVMLFARFIGGWNWNAAAICGIALSTTSVAIVYTVMIETGLNETELGKIILTACFITDFGTVLALGVCFANYDRGLLLFVAVLVAALWLAPRFVRWFLSRHGTHLSEPGVKIIFFVLFGLGALAALSKSEAVLPAYLVGMALAGIFAQQRDTVRRLRTMIFTFLTPFYFLNAGMKVHAPALWNGLGLIALLLMVQLAAKGIGVWPMTRMFRFGGRESVYITLLMATGLTFGTISALFGLNNGYIDRKQYSILVTVVIVVTVAPTLIAQTFFRPRIEPPVAPQIVPSSPSAIPTAGIDGVGEHGPCDVTIVK